MARGAKGSLTEVIVHWRLQSSTPAVQTAEMGTKSSRERQRFLEMPVLYCAKIQYSSRGLSHDRETKKGCRTHWWSSKHCDGSHCINVTVSLTLQPCHRTTCHCITVTVSLIPCHCHCSTFTVQLSPPLSESTVT